MAVMPVIELDNSALRSTVAFTGRLACMTRAEAFEVVRSHGGTPSQAVTRQTDVLVVGELGWPLLDDGRPSNKLSRASIYRTGSAISPMTLNLNGQHVKCKCVLTSFREPVP